MRPPDSQIAGKYASPAQMWTRSRREPAIGPAIQELLEMTDRKASTAKEG